MRMFSETYGHLMTPQDRLLLRFGFAFSMLCGLSFVYELFLGKVNLAVAFWGLAILFWGVIFKGLHELKCELEHELKKHNEAMSQDLRSSR